MAQCTYTTKDVLSMLDETLTMTLRRYEHSDAETESSANSDNEDEMEEDISEIASADEMEVNNETLDDSIDASSTTSSSTTSSSTTSSSTTSSSTTSCSTTVGPSFTATPGPIRDMSYKNPIDFFRLMIPDSILEEIVRQTNLYAEQLFENNNIRPDQEHKCGIPCSTISQS